MSTAVSYGCFRKSLVTGISGNSPIIACLTCASGIWKYFSFWHGYRQEPVFAGRDGKSLVIISLFEARDYRFFVAFLGNLLPAALCLLALSRAIISARYLPIFRKGYSFRYRLRS